MRRCAQDAHTFAVLSRVLTYPEPCRYDYESDLHGRSARMETEGGPPTAKKCRVVEFNGNCSVGLGESSRYMALLRYTHGNSSRGKIYQ
jgi:hypothetical protein